MAHDGIRNWRRRVYQVLEQGPVGDRASVAVDRLLVLLIIVNLVAAEEDRRERSTSQRPAIPLQ